MFYMVNTNLSLVPSSSSSSNNSQESQSKRHKTESSSTPSIVDRLPAAVIRQIAGFVSEESSFPFIRSCKAFYVDVNLVAATFDLSCKTAIAKTANAFFQRRINDSLPFTLPSILGNQRVQQSVRHFEVSFEGETPFHTIGENGHNLAQILQTFSRLQTLSITDGCNISAEGFQALEKCAELRMISFKLGYYALNQDAQNQYRQNFPSLAKIPSLEELRLVDHCIASRGVMPHLSTFTKLKVLSFKASVPLVGEPLDLEGIPKMPNLQTFIFHSCYGITQVALQHITSSKSITNISLQVFLDNDQIAELSNMTQLEKVTCLYTLEEPPFAHLQKLYNAKELTICTESLKDIDKMPNLEKITLLYRDLNDDCIDELIKCEKLKEVVVYGGTPQAAEKLQKAKPNLKVKKALNSN